MPSEAAYQAPNADLAAAIVERAFGHRPRSVLRFGTGSRHYVFDAALEERAQIVVRIGEPSARNELIGAVELSQKLRPLGVPLPALFGYDLDAPFPWLLLERLPGTDLGAVAANLSETQLDQIAAKVARAQAIAAGAGSAGRFGYAARAEEAPYATWPEVLEANLTRSRRRIRAAGLFETGLVDVAAARVDAMRDRLNDTKATPFLHDTTTKNVIVTREGDFSGIVDVDDLCFGDPRYPAALTLASMLGYGGPTSYVSAWLRHAGEKDDAIFRLYVALFLLDLMSEHGLAFNGNARGSTPEGREALRRAFDASISYMTGL
jgi:aminoglycoside phosphotransferase (APT) family kinase protein